jgi:hypothetical protein
MGFFTSDRTESYKTRKSGNGIYIFVIKGSIALDESILSERDALSVEGADQLNINIKAGSEILLMEIPMKNRD